MTHRLALLFMMNSNNIGFVYKVLLTCFAIFPCKPLRTFASSHGSCIFRNGFTGLKFLNYTNFGITYSQLLYIHLY